MCCGSKTYLTYSGCLPGGMAGQKFVARQQSNENMQPQQNQLKSVT